MNNLKARVVGATLGAMIAIGVGGVGMAMAQTADDSTTTTTPPAAGAEPAPAQDDANCPNMGGSSSGTTGSGMSYGSRV